jgi:hypothetical protein
MPIVKSYALQYVNSIINIRFISRIGVWGSKSGNVEKAVSSGLLETENRSKARNYRANILIYR